MEEKQFLDSANLNWYNDINKIATLHRSETPLISRVELDNNVLKASEPFDFKFDGTSKFYPFELPKILENLNFQILVITGASGAGKSVFSRYFGQEENITWSDDKAIASHFANPDDAISRLCATGLASIPTWVKPYKVLSVGEKFRADMARRLKSNCVIDEFTSTVNRETALSCSASISKYIRKNNLQKCVFVSCHKDFIDTLCPDYVVDLDDEAIYDTRRLPRRQFVLSVYETQSKTEVWKVFKQHHYLSSDFNVASKVFVAYLNDSMVAMCAVLPQPGVADGNAWRVHRLVVLPDYQGLGIATKLLEYVCDLFKYHGKIMYLRTSHTKLINHMKNSFKWFGDGKLKHSVKEAGLLKDRKINDERLSASFRYDCPCTFNAEYNYDGICFPINKPDEDKINVESVSLW